MDSLPEQSRRFVHHDTPAPVARDAYQIRVVSAAPSPESFCHGRQAGRIDWLMSVCGRAGDQLSGRIHQGNLMLGRCGRVGRMAEALHEIGEPGSHAECLGGHVDKACLLIQAGTERAELVPLQSLPFPGKGSAQDDDEDQIDR